MYSAILFLKAPQLQLQMIWSNVVELQGYPIPASSSSLPIKKIARKLLFRKIYPLYH